VSTVRLADIVAALGGDLHGNPDTPVERIAPLDAADEHSIAFLSHSRHAGKLSSSRAACVIVAPALEVEARARGATLVCPDPYLYYARLTQWWKRRHEPALVAGVHPSAIVDASAQIAASAHVGALAFVGAGAQIGASAVIGSQSHVGANARVGEHTRLHPHATLGDRYTIGARGILHSGVVIGADGFGFAPVDGRWEKIEQLGAVVIGDDVEIGANTCVDRGALDDTVIEDGVKLDNLIQVAHNVHIGAHTAIAAKVGIAGSTRIGRHCVIGGAAGLVGHIQIADHVQIDAATIITRSISKPGRYSGVYPFDDNASWEKNAATLRQLYALRERLRALEKKS
jgi:UDP-3-O-[3-hydroxymyristoyl] glucosamine N-acyltransferase